MSWMGWRSRGITSQTPITSLSSFHRTRDRIRAANRPAARRPPPTTRHPPPATRHPLPATRYPLPATRYPLPATRYPLLHGRNRLPRQLLIAVRRQIHEHRHRRGVVLHVIRHQPLVRIHVRVVRARAVGHRILDELEARKAHGVEREVIGATRVVRRNGGHARILERRHPFLEDR